MRVALLEEGHQKISKILEEVGSSFSDAEHHLKFFTNKLVEFKQKLPEQLKEFIDTCTKPEKANELLQELLKQGDEGKFSTKMMQALT